MNHASRLAAIAAASLVGMTAAGLSASAGEPIPLPGERLFPEGIAADARGGLYVGSVTEGSILYLAPEGRTVTTFAEAGANGMISTIGLHVSRDQGRLYACSSDLGASPRSGSGAPALVAFALPGGAEAGRFELPGGGMCNDLTELADGTVLATDSMGSRILALRPGAQALSEWISDPRFGGEGFNLNGIAEAEGQVFVVKYNTGALFRIAVEADGSAGAIVEVAMPQPLRAPDGIEAISARELVVVEGGGMTGDAGALLRLTLAGDRATVATLAAALDVPTTAALVGDTAYVVLGQLDHLFNAAEAGASAPFAIAAVPLR